MLTLRQFRLVQALAAFRNFSRAAESVGLTQSAFTRALQAAELDLGVRLFERSAGGARPTEYGRIVLEKAPAVFGALGAIEQEIAVARGRAIGAFSVSSGVFPAELWVARALGLTAAECPEALSHMRIGDASRAVGDVIDEISDLAVVDVMEGDARAEIEVEPLAVQELRLFVRPGHPLGPEFHDVEALTNYPLVGPRWPRSLDLAFLGRWAGRAVRETADGSVRPLIWMENFSGMRHVAAVCDAIGWAPEILLAPYCAAGELRLLNARIHPMTMSFAMIFRKKRRLSPPALRFMEILRRTARSAA